MKTVAIVSMKGGVGRTAVAANLGALLAQGRPRPPLLVDLDPRNQLGLYFGVSASDAAGIALATLRESSWARVLHQRLDGAACVPFGEVTDEERGDLEARLARRPEILQERLADPAFQDRPFALVDAAPGPSAYFQSVLQVADLVIVVALADPASFATLPSLQAQLRRYCRPRAGFGGAHLLLNLVDDATTLSRDVRAAFQAESALSVLPFVIHKDEAVREALAFQRTVIEQAPSSQATADFRKLAEWTLAGLDTVGKDHPQPQNREAAAASAGGVLEQ